MFAEMEYRPWRQITLPGEAGHQDKAELNGINQNNAGPPAVHMREFVSRPKALDHDAAESDAKNNP
jgi:hypothetical protein